MSLSLLGLLTEVMTMVGMEYLYLTGTGNGKSLGRRLMCLDLSHGCISFQLMESGDFLCPFAHRSFGSCGKPLILFSRAFYRRDEHRQLLTVENRLLVNGPDLGYRLLKTLEHLTSQLLMGDLAPLEAEAHSHLVPIL